MTLRLCHSCLTVASFSLGCISLNIYNSLLSAANVKILSVSYVPGAIIGLGVIRTNEHVFVEMTVKRHFMMIEGQEVISSRGSTGRSFQIQIGTSRKSPEVGENLVCLLVLEKSPV